jgi:murein DD-endopeptidase MepM/ murein hydrolase activator NlpD
LQETLLPCSVVMPGLGGQVEGDPKRGTDRILKISATLPSILKAGGILACIAAPLYGALSGAIPTSLTAAIEEVAAERPVPQPVAESLAEIAPAARPPADVWNGIDLGDYRLSDTGPEPSEIAEEEPTPSEQRVVMVRRGDTLLDLLLNAGIARAEAHEAVSALRSVFNPRDLRPGLEITLTLGPPGLGDPPSLLGASFPATAERDIALSRDSDGRFTALRRTKELQRELIRTHGTVRSSLFEAASAAGLPGAIMVELIRALSYDIDFQRDVQPGDAFDVVFERFRDEDGRFAKDGDVIYGALTLSGAKRQIYRYVHSDGTTGYYNEKGENVRKALLRTPIDGARLTSGFGQRMHPILGYSAAHKGADFGAPQGTPVQAAGDGVVETAGWQGAYGQYIRIRHNAEYATAYAHLSRFAAGLRQGDRIRQGQVIGYVGSTGRSTGPHLHYEVIRRGTQINPIAVQLPTVRKLEGVDLIQFRTVKAETDLQIAGLEPVGRIVRADLGMTTR